MLGYGRCESDGNSLWTQCNVKLNMVIAWMFRMNFKTHVLSIRNLERESFYLPTPTSSNVVRSLWEHGSHVSNGKNAVLCYGRMPATSERLIFTILGQPLSACTQFGDLSQERVGTVLRQ